MVIDYSEKRPGTKDSVERKPVQKNRPRREPIGLFAFLAVVALVATFGAGVLTGWLLFHGPKKGAVAPAVAAQPVKKDEAAPPQNQPVPKDAPLTFYNTLPAGGKGAIGSGLNLKKPEGPSVHAAAPAAPAPPVPAPAAQEKEQAAGRYTVQLASYRDKKEAETAQGKLAAKGVAAYLVESKLADKGVWYRLRVGKHLSREEAQDVAGKSGKGAMVLAE